MIRWLRWLSLLLPVAVLLGAAIAAEIGASVSRGQRIGALGTTGQRAWPGYEHVHLELQRGADPRDLHDPLPRMAGCFAAGASYPTDRGPHLPGQMLRIRFS